MMSSEGGDVCVCVVLMSTQGKKTAVNMITKLKNICIFVGVRSNLNVAQEVNLITGVNKVIQIEISIHFK